jgi:hypothetical protein
MRDQEMQAEWERLRAENAQLKNKDKGGLTLKVSEKGAVSLYGMGRFPVTLYKEQWLRILGNAVQRVAMGQGRVQLALCCPCGRPEILALGLCATCYTLKRQDEELITTRTAIGREALTDFLRS